MAASKHRLFIAIPVPGALRRKLEGFCKAQEDRFRQRRPEKLRWVQPADFHLTLFFMGTVHSYELQKCRQALHPLFLRQEPFALTFKEPMYAPPSRKVRMLWAHYGNDPEFVQLVFAVYETLASAGFDIKTPHRQVMPHITLARFRKQSVNQLPRLAPLDIHEPLPVEQACIMESIRNAAGVNYKVLETFDFGGGGD